MLGRTAHGLGSFLEVALVWLVTFAVIAVAVNVASYQISGQGPVLCAVNRPGQPPVRELWIGLITSYGVMIATLVAGVWWILAAATVRRRLVRLVAFVPLFVVAGLVGSLFTPLCQ